jgi:hypothetical protein
VYCAAARLGYWARPDIARFLGGHQPAGFDGNGESGEPNPGVIAFCSATIAVFTVVGALQMLKSAPWHKVCFGTS